MARGKNIRHIKHGPLWGDRSCPLCPLAPSLGRRCRGMVAGTRKVGDAVNTHLALGVTEPEALETQPIVLAAAWLSLH